MVDCRLICTCSISKMLFLEALSFLLWHYNCMCNLIAQMVSSPGCHSKAFTLLVVDFRVIHLKNEMFRLYYCTNLHVGLWPLHKIIIFKMFHKPMNFFVDFFACHNVSAKMRKDQGHTSDLYTLTTRNFVKCSLFPWNHSVNKTVNQEASGANRSRGTIFGRLTICIMKWS